MGSASILSKTEIAAVLKYLKRKARKHKMVRRNLIVFRLSCCLGLRASEICGLCIKDIACGPKPGIRVRRATAKGKVSGRFISLERDAGTYADILAWLTYRKEIGAGPEDPFVCAVCNGHRLSRTAAAQHWHTAIRALGAERVRQLSIHKGRHTWITHSIDAGIPVSVVSREAGHSRTSTTLDVYLHSSDDNKVTNLFG